MFELHYSVDLNKLNDDDDVSLPTQTNNEYQLQAATDNLQMIELSLLPCDCM